MKKTILTLTFIMALALSGCGQWKVVPFTLNNPYYDIKMTTVDYLEYQLTVINKSKSNLEIVWPKTFYIDATNTTNGFLMYDQEITAEDNLMGRSPTIIFPNEKMQRAIYPKNLAFQRRTYWTHNYLPKGRSGVFLTLKLNEKEFNHRLYITIDYP